MNDDQRTLPPNHYDLDLGYEHYLKFTSWRPDRELNPQYAEIPDIERCGAIVWHRNKETGGVCCSGIHFDRPNVRAVFGDKTCWKVESEDPLTTSPSLLCMQCGDHGFIRNGKWIVA